VTRDLYIFARRKCISLKCKIWHFSRNDFRCHEYDMYTLRHSSEWTTCYKCAYLQAIFRDITM